MIEQLKSFSPTKYTLEELIFWSAQATALTNEYIAVEVDVPEWLSGSAKRIVSAINERVRDERERKLSSAKARLASLKTDREKRKEVEDEIAALTAQLG